MTNKVKGTCVPVEYLVLGMLENNVYICLLYTSDAADE